MDYSIKQAADIVNLTAYTLRYYDKEGLLPFVERDEAGHRIFTEHDIEWLGLICCLKDTGMPLKQIKKYIQLCMEGDETLSIRHRILVEHRRDVIEQIELLNRNLERIDYKIEHYNTLCNLVVEKTPATTR